MSTYHRQATEAPLPRGVRPRRQRDWGRRVAGALCVVLAGVGLLPFLAALVVRSHSVHSWVTRTTQNILHEQGISATYTPSVRVWPLALQLEDVRLDASDGGSPALECRRVMVRPKLFALLAGRIAIDEVDLDEPRVRAVVRDGKLVNVAIPQGGQSGGPLHAPFATFSMTEASIVLDIDGIQGRARSLDLDVAAEDDPARGSSFEVAMRAGEASMQRPRVQANGAQAIDDDALCSVIARMRVEPDSILVRRLDAVGMADLNADPGTMPSCALPTDDKRRVEVSLGHLRVGIPTGRGERPTVDGHVRLRAPIGLAERAASLPETDGWIGVDADVRYTQGAILPYASGTLEAHDVRLAQYAFAQELHSEFIVRRNLIESPRTTIRLAGGVITLSDTVVDPLAKGGRLERTRLDVAGVNFTALLRALGVHPNSWVEWDVREIHAALIAGTFEPLKLDGDLTAATYSFGVFDRPAEDRARERLFGFPEAQVAAHLGVRPDGLKFMDLRARLPRSQIDGAFVSIGFREDLRVDVPHVRADLDDISPIGPVPIHGVLMASAHVGGVFNHPEPEGDIQSATGLVIADVSFGDVSAGHVKVDVTKPEIAIVGIGAKKRASAYEVPTAVLRFGGTRGFVVDAVGSSDALGLRDLLSMFALDDDPRFDGLDASIGMRADVHVALDGPEDACGGGYVGVDAKGRLKNVALYGERFAQGTAELAVHWFDRQRGIAGADVDLRSFALDKVAPDSRRRLGATGTVLGSASIRRGGALAANVMIDNVPLSHLDGLGRFASQVEGSVSGVAHIAGNLDDFQPNPGFVARAELDVAGTRIRDVALRNSRLDVRMTHRLAEQQRSARRTRCGAPIGPPFNKQAYLDDVTSHGEWAVSGDLLGDEIHLRDVVVTRARSPRVTGRVALRDLDLGNVARIVSPRETGGESAAGPAAPAIGGRLWGELLIDELAFDSLPTARVRFFAGPTVVSRGSQKLTLQPPREPIVISGDALTMPPLELAIDTSEGFKGGFVLSGGASRLATDPRLSLEARLQPMDLAALERLIPRIERASGRVQGSVRVTGRAAAPTVAGELHAMGDIEARGLPGAVTDIRMDARASATQLTLAATGKFAGGAISFDGTAPIRGLELGTLELRVKALGIHLVPTDGVSATFDADLDVIYDRNPQAAAGSALPRVTGDVAIAALSYTRPITFNLDLASPRAKRTDVSAYDPALDFVTFDVRVRSNAPLWIKNNLVEAQLTIDSGALEATGTNQRLGLRGFLRTVPGGRFHFQASEFEVQQGLIRFDDPTRIAPNVDVTAVTEYRRYTDTSAGAAGGAGAGAGANLGPTAASTGSTRGGSLWRITLHAYGDADNLRVDMTSEPALSQEDIVLLLMVGMTRTELDQLQAGGIGESVALNVLGAASGADRAVKQALPIIDDFRFGSAYSTHTGKPEAQLTVGKRLTNDLRASVTAGISEDRELRSNIEWRLNNKLSVQGSYDNINDVSSSTLGNVGVDLRWRLEFE